MIKSGFLGYRAVTACQVQAWFSLRPYTREQRFMKTVEKQEERLKRAGLRRQDIPIVLQSHPLTKMNTGISPQPTTEAPTQTTSAHVVTSKTATEPSPLIDHTALRQIYNLSEKESAVRLNTRCSGCGAQLHCGTPGTHGFLPAPAIAELKNNENRGRRRSRQEPTRIPKLCIRCQLVNQQEAALGQSLLPDEYQEQVLAEIDRQENSTILLIADMLNLPHSLVPLKLSNPYAHRFVLIGNKVDQLPIDGPNFHSRWCQVLIDAFVKTTGLETESVAHVSLVSALSGYGIQKLLDFLLSKKFNAFDGPVYIVGSTNSGKSSLFNRLLLSDFCKSEARESIHRATVSYWPGTTAGLLKFPLARMSFVKRALREQSKYTQEHSIEAAKRTADTELYGYKVMREEDPGVSMAASEIDTRVERARNCLQDLSVMPTYTLRQASSDGGITIEDSEMGLERVFEAELGLPVSLEKGGDSGDRLLVSGTLDPRDYNPRAWCYDTPGLESPDQTLNLLSQEQLVEYVALTSGKKSDIHRPEKRFLLPRTFVLQPGLSMLVGLLGRVDVLSSDVGPVYLTTHTRLPVHIVETDDVERYCAHYSSFLGPGLSGSSPLPPMESVEMEPIFPVDLDASVADVVLSGAGWVSVAGVAANGATAAKNGVHLKAWTPGGVGISLRQPPLLPYAIRRRGTRLLYLREFSGPDRNATYAQHAPS